MRNSGRLMRALEQIAVVCTDNMDADCNHRMALDFVRQIANEVLAPKVTGKTLRIQYRVEYETWKRVKGRCTNPNNRDYAQYGAKGISMCSAWVDDFEAFFADMGRVPRPPTRLSAMMVPASMSQATADGQRGLSKTIIDR